MTLRTCPVACCRVMMITMPNAGAQSMRDITTHTRPRTIITRTIKELCICVPWTVSVHQCPTAHRCLATLWPLSGHLPAGPAVSENVSEKPDTRPAECAQPECFLNGFSSCHVLCFTGTECYCRL